MNTPKLVVTVACAALVGGGTGASIQKSHDDKAQKRAVNAIIDEAVKDHAMTQGLIDRVNQLESEVQTARRDADSSQEQLARAAEESRAAKVRASRSRRITIDQPVSHISIHSTGGWAASVRGNKIANCESADLQHWPYSDGSRYLGGERGVHLHDSSKYTGKWQMDADFWRTYGGLKYASAPYLASEAEQDVVANAGHAARGEQPWSCAHMV